MISDQAQQDMFAAGCFLALMAHHGEGWQNAAPWYATEKAFLLRLGDEAFAHLDLQNQEAVVAWWQHWNMPLPERVQRYRDETAKYRGVTP